MKITTATPTSRTSPSRTTSALTAKVTFSSAPSGKLGRLIHSNEVLEGKRLFSEGQTDEAQKIFEDILQSSNNAEARYLIGVCHLSKAEYNEAIENLTLLLQHQPLYKRNAYVLLAIAYKKLARMNDALQIVTPSPKTS